VLGVAVKKRILVIDDDKDLLEEILEMLSAGEYEPVGTDDSTTAFALAERLRPDVVLTDVKMKGMNGFQVADRLNQSPVTANIPVIVMTAHFIKEEHVRLMKMLGVRDWIQKPFRSPDILSRIESVCK
jgi:CheY-like chemotaxis protein